MSQLPSQISVPQLPAEALNQFASLFDNMFGSLTISQGRFMKAAVDGLHLGSDEVLPYNNTSFVCLGANRYRHNVWYNTAYQAGKEDRPTLLWVDHGDNRYPDEFPMHLRQKIQLTNGKYGWAYQIKQRTVWALIRQNQQGQRFIDFENYYICDLPSSSLFGKEDAKRRNALTWLGVGQYCQSLSTRLRCPIHPAMFEINFVQGSQVGVVFFRLSQQMFNSELLIDISRWINSEDIKRACEVQEILHIGESEDFNYVAPAPAPTQASVQVQATPAPVQFANISTPTAGSIKNLQTTVAAPAQAQAPVAQPAPAQAQAPVAQPAPAQAQAQAPVAQPAPAQAQAQAPVAQPAPAQASAATAPIQEVINAVQDSYDFSALRGNINILS